MSKPKVITLCGSSRFKDAHEKAQADLTLAGNIIIPMGMYGHLAGIDMNGEIKKRLDELHFRKIDISDGIFVVNERIPYCKECKEFRLKTMGCSCEAAWIGSFKPYIGESTQNEIEYAKSLGKEIIYLNPPK